MKEATGLTAQEEAAMAGAVIVLIAGLLVQCTAGTAQALIMVAQGALHTIGTLGPPTIGAEVLTMVTIEGQFIANSALCSMII